MASDAREVLLQYMVCNGKYNGIPRIRWWFRYATVFFFFFLYQNDGSQCTDLYGYLRAKPDFLEVSVNRYDVLETYHVRSTNIFVACVVGLINDNWSLIWVVCKHNVFRRQNSQETKIRVG
jgi:hypothetical protein